MLPTEIPPIADAGPPQTVTEGDLVTLDGSGSSDPDGTITAYSWIQTGGAPVTLSNPNISNPTFTAPTVPATDTLTFDLTVTDNDGATGTASTSVTVNPLTPPPTDIHDMKVDTFSVPLVVTQGDIVDLQATITNVGNVDEQKVRINYRDTLTQTSIGSQFGISVDVGETIVGNIKQWDTTGAILGDHVLRAKVQLDNSLVDENPSDNNIFVTVTVDPFLPGNQPPIADAGPPQTVTEGDLVTLDGSGSSDPDGTITAYSWIQTGGAPVTLSNPNISNPTFTAPTVPATDTLTFDLTVTDNDGATATASTSVTVNPSTPPPTDIHDMRTDAFSVTPLVVEQGDIINLQATVTNLGNVDESDAKINYRDTTDAVTLFSQKFAINAGDTLVGDVKQWDTSGASIGTHEIKAKAKVTNGFVDDDPSNDNILVTVTINPSLPGNQPPIADAGLPQTVTEGDLVTLDGSASSDPDGTITAYSWIQTGGAPVTLSNPNISNPTFTEDMSMLCGVWF